MRLAPVCGTLLLLALLTPAGAFPPPGPAGAGPSSIRTPPAPLLGGTTYYVTATGAGPTCSHAEPCRQISTALALVHPGDVILVADGTYSAFKVDGVRTPSSAPITIYAQGTHATISPGPRDSITI